MMKEWRKERRRHTERLTFKLIVPGTILDLKQGLNDL